MKNVTVGYPSQKVDFLSPRSNFWTLLLVNQEKGTLIPKKCHLSSEKTWWLSTKLLQLKTYKTFETQFNLLKKVVGSCHKSCFFNFLAREFPSAIIHWSSKTGTTINIYQSEKLFASTLIKLYRMGKNSESRFAHFSIETHTNRKTESHDSPSQMVSLLIKKQKSQTNHHISSRNNDGKTGKCNNSEAWECFQNRTNAVSRGNRLHDSYSYLHFYILRKQQVASNILDKRGYTQVTRIRNFPMKLNIINVLLVLLTSYIDQKSACLCFCHKKLMCPKRIMTIISN